MNKREWYFNEAERLRNIMYQCADEARAANTCVSDDFYVAQKDLLRLRNNYRAYCKRHNIHYSNHDL